MNATPQPTHTGLPENWFLRPAVARIDDYLSGGRENYAADRELAHLLVQSAPWLPDMVVINQRHRPRTVNILARELGITQFLDLGCGLPSSWSRELQLHDPALTYEAAVGVHAAARVVYVDSDPAVCAHARAMLGTTTATASLQADICWIDELLDHPKIHATLDRTQPIAVLVHDLLPWVTDEAAHTAMAVLQDWLAAGSAISVTHATTDMAPDAMTSLVGHYATAGITYRPRPLDHIRSLLGPWPALTPGLVPTAHWRAGSVRCLPSAEHSHAYAAVITHP
ncbi:SAM-dependent methyltransferase [Streptomyces chartreusis]|uniref:SAM-dependent methyltransferase n=1 Tax=Streptomyces chartreusis TaxID=1969 RepID=UPI0036A17E8B